MNHALERAGWAVMLAMACVLPSCRSPIADVDYAREYPRLVQGKTLDIQVVRRGTRVEMTNTTPSSYGPSRLWLNRRFSLPIDGWAMGQTLEFPLDRFVDEFSEKFRPGGFFASEDPDKIVQAQLETPRLEAGMDAKQAQMLGLIVVSGD